MTTKPKFKSRIKEGILASASALHKITMREFDESCPAVPAEIKPTQIKRLREKNHASQPVFARYLGTSENMVKHWESGARKPRGMALKLLSLVQKHGLDVLS